MRLRYKVPLFLFLLSAGPVALVGYLNYLDGNEALVNEIRTHLQANNELDQAEALAEADNLQRLTQTLAAAGVLSVLAILFGVVMTRRSITQPVQLLLVGAREFGRGNLDHRVRVDGSGELAEVASALNEMAEARKEIDSGLERQQEFLQSIYEGVETAIFVEDVLEDGSFRFRSNNPSHVKLTGLGTLAGKSPEDLVQSIPREQVSRIVRKLDDCASRQESIEYEERIESRRGPSWWLTRLTPLVDEEGRVFRIIGTSTAITARKKLEQELQEHRENLEGEVEARTEQLRLAKTRLEEEVEERSRAEKLARENEERFRRIYESVPVGLYRASLEGELLEFNQPLARILGYAGSKELESARIEDFHVDAEEWKRWESLLKEEGRISGFEARLRRADGQEIWVRHSATLAWNAALEIECFEGAVEEITEEKVIEDALEKTLRKFESLVENSSDVISMLAPDGRILYESPSIERVLGYRPDDLVGKDLSELVHPDDLERTRETLADLVAQPGGKFSLEVRFRHQDGKYRVLESTGSNQLENPAVEAIVANSRDVTKRREIEKKLDVFNRELMRSNQELEHFAYVASHDLQEPLRMVASFTQLLSQRYRDQLDEDAQEFIGFAVDGAQRMQQLIQDLLVYSRFQTKGRPFQPVELSVVLGTTLVDLSVRIRESSAIITNEELPTVLGDEGQLGQLWGNLLGNALKFRNPERLPQVHIGASRRENEWLFSVKDNGIGIDPSAGDRIFVIFKRLHARTEYPGTGIGLALCRKIVERHGGRIWYESTPGEGTTFFFTLPLREEGSRSETGGAPAREDS